MGPHPAVAAIRLAVRRVLKDVLDQHGQPPHSPPPLVLVACSGGADSMALASALAFEAPRLGVRAGGVTVDHGLQDGSDLRAREVVARLTALDLAPVESVTVTVGRSGGPEAAAREARYAALDEVAERHRAAAVLLGHTRDDQAETVLLGLARGSGTRSLSGMAECSGATGACGDAGAALDTGTAWPAGTAGATGATATPGVGTAPPTGTPGIPEPLRAAGATASATGTAGTSGVSDGPGRPEAADHARRAASRYRRPFLHIDRQTTRKACMVQSLPVWDDPHNSDPAYTRSRVRHEVLPLLEKALGKGVVEALARTAQLSRDDADALDTWAAAAERAVRTPEGDLDATGLAALPPAVRRRVLRRAVIAAGAPAGSLFARHIHEADRLITAWSGQRALNLPGRVSVQRRDGRLVIRQA